MSKGKKKQNIQTPTPRMMGIENPNYGANNQKDLAPEQTVGALRDYISQLMQFRSQLHAEDKMKPGIEDRLERAMDEMEEYLDTKDYNKS